ncbi:MAG TPA: c-type cytochrome [Pseudolabrys sp.]|nr:c-type cytochrome [Pseudolabrys sp.]
MKRNKLTIAVLAIMSFVAPAWAGGPGNVDVRNCTWCHGPSAQGYAPAPRLAGQRAQYIFNQLSSFNAHARDNPFSKIYMWPAAANLSPGAAHYLAVYLSSVPPKAAEDGNPALVGLGRAIYQGGVPDANVAACAACHGPRAQGVGEIPRLGGLAFAYLQGRLEQWREGYDASALHPMPHVARQLSSQQIAALASYLSFIK